MNLRQTPGERSGRRPGERPRVAIVGCGASGAMVAIELVRRGLETPTDLVIVEPRAGLGRGLAYSTGDPLHLLNVRAGGMSAIESEPRHLLRWAERQGIGLGAEDFLPRRTYGAYLEQTLAEHLRAHENRGGTVEVVRDRVTSVRLDPGGRPRLGCASGAELGADHAVIALGHGPVREPAPVPAEVERSGRYLARPWNRKAGELAADGESLLLVGSGLTMVDAALSIDAASSGVRMVSLSRSGLLPLAHPARPATFAAPFPLPREPGIAPLLAAFLATLTRARAEGAGAAEVVDSMRPATQDVWRRLSLADRAWFLRHLRRSWEVHRHRMAPQVAARVEALRRSGALVLRQGSLERLELDGAKVVAHIGAEGGTEAVAFDRVVNCTGPADDLGAGGNAPFGQMLAEGLAVRDRLGLGLETTLGGNLVGSDGPLPRLHAIGPARKGSLWESTAIPELRRQASGLAEAIAGARPARLAAPA